MFIMKSNLGKRILLLVSVSVLLVLNALVITGWLAIRQGTERVLQERQALAEATGKYLDYILRQNLERLDHIGYEPGVNIMDSDLEPEKRALHGAYLGSIFDEGVFVANHQGKVLWVEPYRPDFVGASIGDYRPVGQSLAAGRPVVSNLVAIEPEGRRSLFMVAPLRNQEGRLVGLAGGQIDPQGRALREFTRLVNIGKTSYIEIVDGDGAVLASSDPQRVPGAQSTADTGAKEVIVSAPLSIAPWAVAVRQAESEAMAPVRTMQQRLILFVLGSLAIAFFLSWGMARSLVRPIAELTTAAQNISRGDLSQPIPRQTDDEIGVLSASLDAMRVALKKSLEAVQQLNRELEEKVQNRTRQLEDSYREIGRKEAARGELLRRLFTAQEEERRRIARELHDETSQSLAGLVMRLETALATPDRDIGRIRAMLADTRGLAVRTIDNVHKIIFDLRPAVLDDLGLLSALRWYAESRLGEPGIRVRVEVTGEEKKLPPQVETALFRVVQEAVTNIARHAEAQNVVLGVEFLDSAVGIEIEDDGKGFDVAAVSLRGDKAEGLGLLGMKERVALLGGRLDIASQVGGGTHIRIEVPLT